MAMAFGLTWVIGNAALHERPGSQRRLRLEDDALEMNYDSIDLSHFLVYDTCAAYAFVTSLHYLKHQFPSAQE